MTALPDRFFNVGGGVFRSAQPTTAEQWQTLRDAYGIRRVLKLNFPVEGDEAGASDAGLDIIAVPIEPEGGVDFWDEVEGVFVSPSQGDLERILSSLQYPEGPILVHCTHGQDRTGLVIGMLRVLRDRWTRDAAWEEMIAHGFHRELVGLVVAWERFRP